jgi:3-deoxy-manno-octulosonate cytidylyltransferase (CMP-KDO synthetase)
MNIVGLIPVRIESSRLPNKALVEIASLPMITHVVRRSMMSKLLDRVIVCTDSPVICNICIENKFEVVLTKNSHSNGTERIAEAARILKLHKDTIVIDIQGDEPLLDPVMIDNVVRFCQKNNYDIVVPYLEVVEANSKNRVKLVVSGNKVIYMSRSVVPFNYLKNTTFCKHLSIIGFKYEALLKFADSPPLKLEEIEGIELLRAIELGLSVGTFKENGESLAVDTEEDLQKVQQMILRDKIYLEYNI